jgi:hypothetical protein
MSFVEFPFILFFLLCMQGTMEFSQWDVKDRWLFILYSWHQSHPYEMACEPFAISSTRGGLIILNGLSAI